MCDLSKWKSPGYCRGRNKMRIVPMTKLELRIPGSKPYWDKVCNEIEKNMQHVRDPFSYFLLEPSDPINTVSPNLNDSLTEPIVKISPPTPLRVASSEIEHININSFPDNNEKPTIDRADEKSQSKASSENVTKPFSYLQYNRKESEMSQCIDAFLSTGKVHTKSSCPFHKNKSPVQFFDDNLKNVLPMKRPKLQAPNTTNGTQIDHFHSSKVHSRKICPLRSRPTTSSSEQKTLKPAIDMKEQDTTFHIRSKTAGPRLADVQSDFKTTSESSKSIEIASSSNRNHLLESPKKANHNSKSKLLESNLKSMLDIPELIKIANDDNLFNVSSKKVTFSDLEDYKMEIKKLTSPDLEGIMKDDVTLVGDRKFLKGREFKVPKLGTVSLHPSFNKVMSTESLDEICKSLDENKASESSKDAPSISVGHQRLSAIPNKSLASRGSDKNLIMSEKSKNFLRVPKLGMISSYPSFSKLSSANSLDEEDSQQSRVAVPRSRNLRPLNDSSKDFLKVPKLGSLSIYPSFGSLSSNSFEKDNNMSICSSQEYLISESASEIDHESFSGNKESKSLTGKTETLFTSPRSILKEETDAMTKSTSTIKDTKNISLKLKNSEEVKSLTGDQIVENKKAGKRHDLKYSVKYAYRALKFLTPNKNLDFTPKNYDLSQKSFSSRSSSSNSRSTDPSEIDAAFKVLTREDVLKDMPVSNGSTTSYGSVKNRLRKNAAKFLGSDILPSRSLVPRTSSVTIESSTRSTSGPTSELMSPILKQPSASILNKIPKMSVFPRKNRDRCFACLHKPFQDRKVEVKRELPLTILNAITNEPIPEVAESDSSSMSIADFENIDNVDFESVYEQNQMLDLTADPIRSPLEVSNEIVSSRSSNLDATKSTRSSLRVSQESLFPKNASNLEAANQSPSPKGSPMSISNSKSLSVSSDHSKPSSFSGHSSESDDGQITTDQNAVTSKSFVPCHAPLNLRPSLEALKALRSKKPVSLYLRNASVNKSVDGSDSEASYVEIPTNKNRVSQKEDSCDEESSRQIVEAPSIITNSLQNQQVRTDQGSVDDANRSLKATMDQPVLSITKGSLSGDERTLEVPEEGGNVPVPKLSRTTSEKSLFSGDSKRRTFTKLKSVPENLSSIASLKPSMNDIENETSNLKGLESRGSDQQPLSKNLVKSLSSVHKINIESSSLEPVETFDKTLISVQEASNAESNLPIDSDEDVAKTLEHCIEMNATPLEMLKALSSDFVRDKLLNREDIADPEVAKSAKIAKDLVKLLIESKEYLNPDQFSSSDKFSSKQPPLCNTRQLRRILPLKSYNLVAHVLGMPRWYSKRSYGETRIISKSSRDSRRMTRRKTSLEALFDMVVHPPTVRFGSNSQDDKDFEYPTISPYALFIDKPRRKAVTWRPLRKVDLLGYDPEATLNMRATRVTNKICEDFCDWARGLGGTDEGIDEEVLRDMFQIDFTAEACRTMQVLIKEMPMVPTVVALTRNSPGAGELALTRRHLVRDAKAERRPRKVVGFGTFLPKEGHYIPPKNRTEEKWLQCENVPRDLETMDTVWKGITHLDSVKGFLTWLREHPQVKPPKALEAAFASKGPTTRQSLEDVGLAHLELETDQIQSLKVGDNDPDANN